MTLVIRGVRFNVVKRLADFMPKSEVMDESMDELMKIADCIAQHGWRDPCRSVDLRGADRFLRRTAATVVIDHMGRGIGNGPAGCHEAHTR